MCNSKKEEETESITPVSPCDVLHNRLKHRLSDENIHVELKYKDILDEGHRRQKKRRNSI